VLSNCWEEKKMGGPPTGAVAGKKMGRRSWSLPLGGRATGVGRPGEWRNREGRGVLEGGECEGSAEPGGKG